MERMLADLESAADPLAPARRLFSTACLLSRAHDSLTREALAEFGDHGPQISGCIRDHFPESVKETLRTLSRQVADASDAAWSLRPPRVHSSTMRKLAQSVARTEGSGFYGPRA
jgi:hypothetical protein